MSAYLDLLTELEAIRARRHDRDYQAWLDKIAQISSDAGIVSSTEIGPEQTGLPFAVQLIKIAQTKREFDECLAEYDARKAREMSEAEHDALERARDMQIEAQSWERGE